MSSEGVFHRELGSYLEVRIIHSHKENFRGLLCHVSNCRRFITSLVRIHRRSFNPLFPKPGRNWSSFPPPGQYVRDDWILDLCKLTGYDRDVRDSRLAKP